MGYGKIGKILSKDLFGMGAQTFAMARKHADLAMIESHGYEPLPFASLKGRVGDFDIIFNTVPAMVMDGGILSRVRKDALVIDLASKPGGAGFYLDKVFANHRRFFSKGICYITQILDCITAIA